MLEVRAYPKQFRLEVLCGGVVLANFNEPTFLSRFQALYFLARIAKEASCPLEGHDDAEELIDLLAKTSWEVWVEPHAPYLPRLCKKPGGLVNVHVIYRYYSMLPLIKKLIEEERATLIPMVIRDKGLLQSPLVPLWEKNSFSRNQLILRGENLDLRTRLPTTFLRIVTDTRKLDVQWAEPVIERLRKDHKSWKETGRAFQRLCPLYEHIFRLQRRINPPKELRLSYARVVELDPIALRKELQNVVLQGLSSTRFLVTWWNEEEVPHMASYHSIFEARVAFEAYCAEFSRVYLWERTSEASTVLEKQEQ